MKRLVIIGNGAGVLKTKKRDFIDESDVVVRLNNFKVYGFEDFVGTKFDIYSCQLHYLDYIDTSDDVRIKRTTDLWDFYCSKHPKIVKTYSDEALKKEKEDYIKIYTFPNVQSSKLKEILHLHVDDKSKLKEYPFNDKIQVADMLFDLDYSTGVKTILYCLNRFKDHQICVTGFDCFFASGWYWDYTSRLADRFVRTENYTDPHPYLFERTKLKELVKSGTITDIS